jgi:uncharacterized surface anchored protein
MNIRKITAAILAAILLIGATPLTSLASDWGGGDTLEDALSELKVGFDGTQLDWLALPTLGVVKLRYTYFMFINERTGTIDEHPVYCIDPTKGGAYEIVRDIGANSDGSSTATYIRGDKAGDAKYRGILSAGYPHQQLGSIGLQTREEGYYATKLALWMYIRGSDPAKLTINPAYGDSDAAALRVRAAAIAIYNNGVGGSNYEPNLTLTGKPNSAAKLDADKAYYVQEIEAYSSGWIGENPSASGDVKLAWESAPPAGTIVLGSNGEDVTASMNVVMNTVSGKTGRFGKVTVKYPSGAVNPDDDVQPTLRATAILPNSEIYVAYAKVNKDKYQRYLVERDPKIEISAAFFGTFSVGDTIIDFPGLRIRKLETGTSIPLEGAIFEIRDPEGRLIYSLSTDEFGLIDVPLSVVGNYTVTETVPPRYHLLPERRTQSVYVRYGETAEVTFENDPYGTLRVVKRDASNGRPLGGAAVRIKHIATNATREGFTDSSGSAVFEKLPIGAYEIVEITAPDGYALDATVHTVNVAPLSEGETGYALVNKANPGLRIIKFDRQGMTPIAGVTFEIWKDGELFGTYITDAWGEIELRNLPSGTYLAREVAAAEPYALDDTVQWIELKAGQGYISELVFFNIQKPGMRLVKVDSEALAPLANARFGIARVGGAYANEFTTDHNGEIDLSVLEPGAYEVTELAAPDGYLIDDATRVIQLNAGETAQFVFTNTEKPAFELTKLDSKTGLPIAGATFRVAKIEDGSHYLDRVTDARGRIEIANLDPGVYSIAEMTAPDGYVEDETEYHIQLFPGRTSTLAVSNAHKPDLKIVKRDTKTGELLANASFKIKKADSSTYATITTDGTGSAWLYDLDPGVYEITETLTPPGYLPNETPQLITLFPNRVGIAEFTNYKKPGLTILKVDETTSLPLSGAEFSVKRKDGSIVWEGLTDANGEIHLADLDPDWYTITEIAAPYGYLKRDESKDVKFEPGKVTQVKFDNRLRPALKLIKVDEQTKAPLAGAKFRVTQTESLTTGEYVTGADGTITIYNLAEAIYSVEEISAPKGYILDPQHKDIQLEWGKVKELVFTNKEKPALVILKVDEVTSEPLANAEFSIKRKDGSIVWEGLTDPDGEIRLTELEADWYTVTEILPPHGYIADTAPKDVKFEPDKTLQVKFDNIRKPTLIVTKTDATSGKGLAGTLMKIERRNANGGLDSLGSYRTNTNGQIIIPNAEPGDYVITELQPPQGYSLPSSPVTEIHLAPGENAYLGLIGTDSESNSGSTDSTGNENAAAVYALSASDGAEYAGQEAPNYPLNSIVLRKTDAITGELLSGAAFELRRVSEDISGGSGTIIGRWTTNHTGTIVITGLEPGGYIAEEVQAPSHYTLSENAQQQIWLKADGTSIAELTFANFPYPGLVIRKYDSVTKAPLSGAEFLVTDSGGAVVGTSNGKYTTDADGIIQIPNVPAGSYVIRETKAPGGYLLDDVSQTIAVENNGKTYTVDFYNAPMSSARIIKLDAATKQPLRGAKFTVCKANGEVVGTYETNSDGVIILPQLEPGWYKAAETKAPDGYILDGAPQDFEITSGQFLRLTFENTAFAGLLIVKTDEQTGQPLAGVEFEVRKPNGERIGIFTTDINGHIRLTDLSAGTLIVTETQPLPGYEPDAAAREATITPGRVAALRVTNRRRAGFRLLKIDSVTKLPIYGAEFTVYDEYGEPVGAFTTDNNGLIDFTKIFGEGRYTIRETRPADGYYRDDMPRTVEFERGKVTDIVWENTPQMAQIQITKLSGDDNEQNGLPKGSPLSGAIFEAYEYKSGNLADRFISGSDGRAISNPLPLGRYTVKEVQAPPWYKLGEGAMDITLEFATQILKLEYLNYSANTGVTIRKTGVYETMPESEIRYDIRELRNDSTMPLTDFYWRDIVPTDAARITRLVTGMYNQSLKYKVLVTTNKGDTRVAADNLSTTKNNVIDLRCVALGLASDEYVTSVTLIFGTVKAGFAIVETPQIYMKTLSNLPSGYEFANKCDVAGKYEIGRASCRERV